METLFLGRVEDLDIGGGGGAAGGGGAGVQGSEIL